MSETVESIKTDILNRLSVSNLDTREGSYTNDIVSAVAVLLWKNITAQEELIDAFYIDENSGPYIDKQSNWYGKPRKAGKTATVTLTISGTDRTIIPAEKVFLTADGYQFTTDAQATITGGTAAVPATAADVGAAYNVAAGTITMQIYNLSGITSVTNAAAAFGGADAETDAGLFSRLDSYRKSTPTSGNAADYKGWALAVDGVGDAKVFPLWNGNGTVKVLIVDSNKAPVPDSVVTACAAYIEAMRPIGATVTVLSATGLAVNVSAAVTIDSTTTKATVQTAFAAALKSYLQGIAFSKYMLVYNRIAALLQDIPGVQDFSSLTVNGGTANIAIADNQVPVMGTVVIS